jgi:hypothetical protein
MRILSIIQQLTQSISKGFSLFLFERGNYVETAYTPGLHNRSN